MRTAACVIVKNEAPFLGEWIAYQRVIGFTSVIVYDNGSTDDTLRVASLMGNVLDVRIHHWPESLDPQSQMNCYQACIKDYAAEFDWIALIDADEFLVSSDGSRVYSLLHRNRHASAIALNWLCFGSNGHNEQHAGLTTTAFTRRSDVDFGPNSHTKMVVRPPAVRSVINAHCTEVDGLTVWPNGTQMTWQQPGVTHGTEVGTWQINHYFVRSRAQWAVKVAKGYSSYGAQTTRRMEDFEIYDRNEILDAKATRYAGEVTDIMAAAMGSGSLAYPGSLLPA